MLRERLFTIKNSSGSGSQPDFPGDSNEPHWLQLWLRARLCPVPALTAAVEVLMELGYASPNAGGNGGYAAASSVSAPVPGTGRMPATAASAAGSAQPGGKTKYHDLPITADSAKYRLEELRALLAVSRPQDMQDSVTELCEWLNDASDAHYRMYLSFAKSDLTKAQANSEKGLNQHFSQLKREAQLLRADLLIKQLRAPGSPGSPGGHCRGRSPLDDGQRSLQKIG